jgi:hypothetical protein
MRRPRKTAITLAFDTQSSRADAIPPKIVELVKLNACFAVKSRRSNDGILGDGTFQAGIRATEHGHVDNINGDINGNINGEDNDEFDDPYFSAAERERLQHWRRVCAQRPPLTREQIDTVGALLRALDQRRASKTDTSNAKK